MPLTRSMSANSTASTQSNNPPGLAVTSSSGVITTAPPLTSGTSTTASSNNTLPNPNPNPNPGPNPDPPTPPGRSVRMSLPAKTLEKQLRPFDGTKSKLAEFLSICEAAIRLVAPAEKTILFELIKLKLTDRAYQATKYRAFATFEELKTHLTELFGDKQSRQRLETAFYSCRQGPSEDVPHFAERVENNLYKLLEHITSSVAEEHRQSHEQQLRIQAKNIFITGLKDPLALLLKARDPATLEEAIGLAITEDREFNSRRELFRSGPSGSTRPNSNGHTSNNGHNSNNRSNGQNSTKRFNYNNGSPKYPAKPHFNHSSASSSTQFGKNGSPSGSQFKSKSEIPPRTKYDGDAFCTFCKIKGHDLSVCRSKKRAESVSAKSYSLNYDRAPGNPPR